MLLNAPGTANTKTMEQLAIEKHLHGIAALLGKKTIESDSLGYGKSAVALFFFYYGACFGRQEATDRGVALVQEIFDQLENGSAQRLQGYDLYGGLGGVMRTLSVLQQDNLLDIDMDEMAAIDKMLLSWAMNQAADANSDLFHGATGILSYFKDRAYKPGTPDDSMLLVLRMLQLAQNGQLLFPNTFYNKEDNQPEGEINFSMVHGMTSFFLCLLDYYEKGRYPEGMKESIEKGIDYITGVSAQMNVPKPYCFVMNMDSDLAKGGYQQRLGWCYSDLNILHLLYRGAVAFERTDWKLRADTLGVIVAGRISRKETLVDDPYLCHGSAGLFLYYQALYSFSPLASYQEAMDHWLRETISYLEEMPYGYYDNPDCMESTQVHSLFYGPTGTGLCLLAACNPHYSSWRKIILL